MYLRCSPLILRGYLHSLHLHPKTNVFQKPTSPSQIPRDLPPAPPNLAPVSSNLAPVPSNLVPVPDSEEFSLVELCSEDETMGITSSGTLGRFRFVDEEADGGSTTSFGRLADMTEGGGRVRGWGRAF